jgi:hypothetical protein
MSSFIYTLGLVLLVSYQHGAQTGSFAAGARPPILVGSGFLLLGRRSVVPGGEFVPS